MSYAVCLSSKGYAASLEPRKLYELLPDENAKSLGMLRVVDGSGEGYLYPAEIFVPLQLPESLEEALKSA
ncbi:MAG: hypothetical protein ACYCZQ_14260 [Burkholderiales bacterium]